MRRLLLLVALAIPAVAQAQMAQPTQPTTEQLRDSMLSSEAAYYLRIAQDMQKQMQMMQSVEAQVASYWAEYVKGLPEQHAQKE